MTCRGGSNFNGPWGSPTMMALEGGSAGLQLGGNATDFVLLLMSPRSATNMLSSKVKLGGDATAAAGPVGRTASAESDVALRADNNGNKKLYGTTVSADDIVFKRAVPVPPSSKVLLATLEKASPKNKSNK
jgi:lipid-binding SYLF domain-containing protein